MDKVKKGALVILWMGILAIAILTLVGCESPAAQRLRAQADLEYARASAYAQRVAADEARRENGHQRALEILPFLALLVLGGTVGILSIMLGWDIMRRRAVSPPPSNDNHLLLLHLERLRLDQARHNRELWRAIMTLDRRSLSSGTQVQTPGEIVIIDH